MAGEREIGEETRNQMMQNLFGDQSEGEEEVDGEEEDDDDVESDRGHFAPRHPVYHPEEAEDHAEIEGEGEIDIEGQGEVEAVSDGEMHGVGADQGESEEEGDQSSQGRDISDQRSESVEKDVESEEHGYGQRGVTSKRRELSPSESERSEEDHRFDDNDEVDIGRARKVSSPSDEQDNAVVRDVFGNSDEDEDVDYDSRNKLEQDQTRTPVEEDGRYEKDLGPEDMVPDDSAHFESDEDNAEQKAKEKPTGPHLDMEIPLQKPPGMPEKMNMIKVSNIMGIEPKPFDPKTYVEEDVFVTDESGAKKRIRLEDNIVRWRSIRNRDGSMAYESNARFVKWSDGSLQLLIGNEVLDLSVQEAQHDHTHLFLRHGKGILQSQGRLLRKMRFMPSSLSSKSHRLLTALVDSRHKKVYKVKNCITDIDPEREKEEKERAEGQSIRANELLQRKREKVTKKYTPSAERGRQLSPGFLEEAIDEDDEHEDYSSRKSAVRRRFEEDMELESQAERRIMNAKRSHAVKDSRKKSLPSHSSRRPVEEYSESERDESEYESEGEDIERSPVHRRSQSDNEDEYEEQDDGEEAGAANVDSEDEEDEEPRNDRGTGGGGMKRKELDSDVEESPPRKSMAHRRKAVVFDSDED